jgi:tripartite-type tricarboxylate transporter receptor subunit TctC
MKFVVRAARSLALALPLLCLAGPAPAEWSPSGPVNLVVPLAPGDAADIAARAMAEEMSRSLKTPVVVVNRQGAGGAIGANSVVQAKKDGQTILFAPNSALTFRPVLDPQSVTYDPLRDLVPLGIGSRTPSLLAVRADAPFKTFAELVEYAKGHPDRVRIGHPGAGSVGEFGIQLMNVLTGAKLVPVPYAGAAPSITDLRGGHIEGVVLAQGALSSHLVAGAFRGLVSSSRITEFGDIPTLRQLGYREELLGIWFGFYAPAGIPEAARVALVEAIEKAVKAPAIAARLAPLGIVQSHGSPEQTTAEIQAELVRVKETARTSGLVR